jgi:hypothetical protein
MTRINAETLKLLVRSIIDTRDSEIACDSCFDKLDQFVELHLADKAPEQALPLVQQHLEDCQGCCQEYEALKEALESIEADNLLR